MRFAQHGHDGGWVFGEFIVLWTLLALLIVAAIVLVNGLAQRRRGGPSPWTPFGRPPGPPPPPRSPALDELDMRYARGDVGRDEYLGRRADLMAFLAPPPWTAAAPPTSTSLPSPPAGGPIDPPVGPSPAVPAPSSSLPPAVAVPMTVPPAVPATSPAAPPVPAAPPPPAPGTGRRSSPPKEPPAPG